MCPRESLRVFVAKDLPRRHKDTSHHVRCFHNTILFIPSLIRGTLYQKDVSRVIEVDTLTVCNRENNLTAPRLYLLPKIYNFLVYIPSQCNATALRERIKQYRIQKELSIRRLAKEWGIDPGTLARWEGGRSNPTRKLMIELQEILDNWLVS